MDAAANDAKSIQGWRADPGRQAPIGRAAAAFHRELASQFAMRQRMQKVTPFLWFNAVSKRWRAVSSMAAPPVYFGIPPPTIHGVPKRSTTMPKACAQKVFSIGMLILPPSARPLNMRRASSGVS